MRVRESRAAGAAASANECSQVSRNWPGLVRRGHTRASEVEGNRRVSGPARGPT
jgi:hypothetical protein